MAKNFRVLKKNKSRKLLCLQLFGDFDGASANQLLYMLSQKIKKTDRVTIDTNGLRHVGTFGIELFLPRISQLNRKQVNILYTGKFKSKFSNG